MKEEQSVMYFDDNTKKKFDVSVASLGDIYKSMNSPRDENEYSLLLKYKNLSKSPNLMNDKPQGIIEEEMKNMLKDPQKDLIEKIDYSRNSEDLDISNTINKNIYEKIKMDDFRTSQKELYDRKAQNSHIQNLFMDIARDEPENNTQVNIRCLKLSHNSQSRKYSHVKSGKINPVKSTYSIKPVVEQNIKKHKETLKDFVLEADKVEINLTDIKKLKSPRNFMTNYYKQSPEEDIPFYENQLDNFHGLYSGRNFESNYKKPSTATNNFNMNPNAVEQNPHANFIIIGGGDVNNTNKLNKNNNNKHKRNLSAKPKLSQNIHGQSKSQNLNNLPQNNKTQNFLVTNSLRNTMKQSKINNINNLNSDLNNHLYNENKANADNYTNQNFYDNTNHNQTNMNYAPKSVNDKVIASKDENVYKYDGVNQNDLGGENAYKSDYNHNNIANHSNLTINKNIKRNSPINDYDTNFNSNSQDSSKPRESSKETRNLLKKVEDFYANTKNLLISSDNNLPSRVNIDQLIKNSTDIEQHMENFHKKYLIEPRKNTSYNQNFISKNNSNFEKNNVNNINKKRPMSANFLMKNSINQHKKKNSKNFRLDFNAQDRKKLEEKLELLHIEMRNTMDNLNQVNNSSDKFQDLMRRWQELTQTIKSLSGSSNLKNTNHEFIYKPEDYTQAEINNELNNDFKADFENLNNPYVNYANNQIPLYDENMKYQINQYQTNTNFEIHNFKNTNTSAYNNSNNNFYQTSEDPFKNTNNVIFNTNNTQANFNNQNQSPNQDLLTSSNQNFYQTNSNKENIFKNNYITYNNPNESNKNYHKIANKYLQLNPNTTNSKNSLISNTNNFTKESIPIYNDVDDVINVLNNNKNRSTNSNLDYNKTFNTNSNWNVGNTDDNNNMTNVPNQKLLNNNNKETLTERNYNESSNDFNAENKMNSINYNVLNVPPKNFDPQNIKNFEFSTSQNINSQFDNASKNNFFQNQYSNNNNDINNINNINNVAVPANNINQKKNELFYTSSTQGPNNINYENYNNKIRNNKYSLNSQRSYPYANNLEYYSSTSSKINPNLTTQAKTNNFGSNNNNFFEDNLGKGSNNNNIDYINHYSNNINNNNLKLNNYTDSIVNYNQTNSFNLNKDNLNDKNNNNNKEYKEHQQVNVDKTQTNLIVGELEDKYILNKNTLLNTDRFTAYDVKMPLEYYHSVMKSNEPDKNKEWYICPHHTETFIKNKEVLPDDIMNTKYISYYAEPEKPEPEKPEPAPTRLNLINDLIGGVQENIDILRKNMEKKAVCDKDFRENIYKKLIKLKEEVKAEYVPGKLLDSIEVKSPKSTDIFKTNQTNKTDYSDFFNQNDEIGKTNYLIKTYETLLKELRNMEKDKILRKRKEEYEKVRPPVDKWWEIKSKNFQKELQRNSKVLNAGPEYFKKLQLLQSKNLY